MRSSGDGEIDVDLLSWWRHQPFVDHCADEGDHCADEGLAQVEQVQPCASRAAQPRHPSPQPRPVNPSPSGSGGGARFVPAIHLPIA